MRRSYEDYFVLEEVGFVEIMENIGVALERACDVLEKLLANNFAGASASEEAAAALTKECGECCCGQSGKVDANVPTNVPTFKIGADLSSAVDENVIGRIFGIV